MTDETTFDMIDAQVTHPLIVYAHGREVMRVTIDRQLIVADDVTLDDAAHGFVTAVNRMFAAYGEAVSPTTGTAA